MLQALSVSYPGSCVRAQGRGREGARSRRGDKGGGDSAPRARAGSGPGGRGPAGRAEVAYAPASGPLPGLGPQFPPVP